MSAPGARPQPSGAAAPDGRPAPRDSVVRRALDGSRRAASAVAGRYRRSLLTLVGLVLLTAAAWTVDLTAGLAAAGVSCLVLEYLNGRERTSR